MKEDTILKKIKNIVAEVCYFFIIKLYKFPLIKNEEETIEKIISQKCSIARFGDGEIRLLKNSNISFQEPNKELSDRLNEIIVSEEENILICLPNIFKYKDFINVQSDETLFWKKEVVLFFSEYKKAKKSKIYYNSLTTRPYMRYNDKSNAKIIFEKMKKIWDNKDIVFVEGNETKLGIGNDLFSNAKSISRILCPQKNAFSKYDEIIGNILKLPKDKLIIIALGPTATVLAYDLSKKGYQALDLGHIDLEYEWFKMGATSKVKVQGKYTNEVVGGDKVQKVYDKQYEKQILYRIN